MSRNSIARGIDDALWYSLVGAITFTCLMWLCIKIYYVDGDDQTESDSVSSVSTLDFSDTDVDDEDSDELKLTQV